MQPHPLSRRLLIRLGLGTAVGVLSGCLPTRAAGEPGPGGARADAAAEAGAAAWPWPDSLDAMRAAPNHHTVLLENERVRVLAARIGAGERTAVHTHRWPAAHHVVSWSDFVRRDAEEAVVLDTRLTALSASPPPALWGDPLPPHSLENVGGGLLYIVSVELKPGAGGP